MSTARRAKVAAAVKSIREFWALGRSLPRRPPKNVSRVGDRSVPRRPHEKVYGEEVNKSAAEANGMNADTVGKARQFADPTNGYTAAEVNAMCRMIREVQTKQPENDERGKTVYVFSRTHVIRLLTVPKRLRPGIQKAAITKGWSTSQLESQIAARFGSRSAGGRPRRVPIDVLGQLVQVERMCDTWARWVSVAERQREDQPPRSTHLSDLPPRVQRLADKATAAIAKLHRALLKEMAGRRTETDPGPRPTAEGAEGPNRRRPKA